MVDTDAEKNFFSGVGQNLQDHYGSMGIFGTVEQPIAMKEERFMNLQSVVHMSKQYTLGTGGPLTSLGESLLIYVIFVKPKA